jgi:integrase
MDGKAPTHSTQLTHNAALNKVFDEAMYRGYLNANNRPTLKAKGNQSVRRVEFSIDEVKALRHNFDAWIASSRADTIELRYLLKDYVEVLLDTGARPGKELLDLKWAQIDIKNHPTSKRTGKILPPDEYNDAGEEEIIHSLNRTAYIRILSGKTSVKNGVNVGRLAIGNLNSVRAFERIALRNYGLSLSDAIKQKAQENIFRYKQYQSVKNGRVGKEVKFLFPTDFVKLFRSYLESHNLLIDPVTNQARPLYSLRHTYATIRLLHDKITPQIIVKQMGTSLAMLEKHYDHINTLKAVSQLRDEESRSLIDAGGEVDERYEYVEVRKTRAKRAKV